ncbi:carbohydrate ABC transporter permease [Aminobacterium sp. MB27-C1]|uniref:carbohydrate ABC transporter permease n=1 Tax=unclassified Aminobacterium TaxID=2685012 RepID=UPI001BD0E46E|nr:MULTISPECIES: carbohydrate ABC transporter permease [unclassified Aminobacterium]MEA4878470.1 carbohydrate ABC transporter permease [Aminobacterium sp.]WMI71015.1 carbohydrate ABC transporter permease [Aminobacterium sp. MB27-C1]
MNKKIIHLFLYYLILVGCSFLFLLPFLWTLTTSFKPDSEIYSKTFNFFPINFDFSHYENLTQGSNKFFCYFSNTVAISIVTIALVLLLSALAGYAFASLEFKGKKYFLFFMSIVITVPLATYLVPIYMMEDKFGLINTRWGLILPYVAVNLPFASLIMRASFKKIPNELIEAAVIDGCSLFQVWLKILLPLVKPGLFVVTILTFINVWGEFMFAKTLANTYVAQTLPVGITFLRDEAASWQYGTLSAVIILSLIPVGSLFLILQKYIVKGLNKI